VRVVVSEGITDQSSGQETNCGKLLYFNLQFLSRGPWFLLLQRLPVCREQKKGKVILSTCASGVVCLVL